MKANLLFAILLFGVAFICKGQKNNIWDRWNWLIGEWQGEGSGQPGNKPQIIHDDLMIVYLDNGDNHYKAVYFDNEGHTIFYSAVLTEGSIILTSNETQENPVFRLIHNLLDDDTVFTQFEISQDGKEFIPYIEGKSNRIRNNP